MSEKEDELLTVSQVADLLYVSTRTVWRLTKVGDIPQPLRFSRKLVRWRKSDIMNVIKGTK